MRVGIVGAGRIGGNAARLLAAADHEVKLSFARDRSKLTALASEISGQASAGTVLAGTVSAGTVSAGTVSAGTVAAGTVAEAAAFGDVVILAVPWDLIPQALGQAGGLAGKVVVDTTNQFGSGPMPAAGQTAAQFNAARMPGARYTKSFNTLTADPSDAAVPALITTSPCRTGTRRLAHGRPARHPRSPPGDHRGNRDRQARLAVRPSGGGHIAQHGTASRSRACRAQRYTAFAAKSSPIRAFCTRETRYTFARAGRATAARQPLLPPFRRERLA